MKRPYTICHIFSALDGAITGDFMYIDEIREGIEEYGKLRSTFNSNAILYGTTTMLEFCNEFLAKSPLTYSVHRQDYIASHTKDKYIIALDCKGVLAYEKNYLVRHEERWHIIEILTESVSDEYLLYLQQRDISYIFAGKKDLDCEVAMMKLKKMFGIERLIIAGGGYTNWSFADAGMIDELSLVVAPVADGEQKVTVFERGTSSKHHAITFTLKNIKQLKGNAIWLQYELNNAKK